MPQAAHHMNHMTRNTILILFILSGLTFQNFLSINSIKVFGIAITYLRVVLLLSIPLFLCSNPFFRRRDAFFYLFLLFMIYSLTRIGDNYKEAFSIYSVMIAFLMIYVLVQDNKTITKCINFLAGCLIFFTLYGLFEMFTGIHLVETYFQGYYGTANVKMLAAGIFYNQNDFSAFLVVLVFYMLLSNFNKLCKAIFICIAIFIIYCNDSNMSLVGLLAFLAVYCIAKSKDSRQAILRLIVILFLSFLPMQYLIGSSSIYWRSLAYSYGIRVCEAFPLFGTGIGNYSEEMIKLGCPPSDGNISTDPHCLFLELGGQFGIPWLILFVLLLICLLVWYAKRIKEDSMVYMFGLVFIIPFIGLASSSCMEKNFIYLALLIPVLYWNINKDSSNKRSPCSSKHRMPYWHNLQSTQAADLENLAEG